MSVEEVRPAKGAAEGSMHLIADPRGRPRLMQWLPEKDYGNGLWYDMRYGSGGTPEQFRGAGFRYLCPFDPAEVVAMHEVCRLVRHVKSGNIYRELARGRLEKDQTPVVVYRRYPPDSTEVWVRPVAEFDDGRFVPVEGGAADGAA